MTSLCFDYGHGGADPGATYKGRFEKDDVIEIGKQVARNLRGYKINIDETRTADKTISLNDRSKFERRKKYDYFISFHRNAFQPEKARGVETFTYTRQTQKAKSLADKIQRNLVGVGFVDRKVKKANFHVLRETLSPAVLIEIGFIDNSLDNKILDTKFKDIVEAITKAILEELGIRYNDSNKADINKKEILYRVMAGSYSNKDNATSQVQRLKKAGFDAVIMPYKA